MGDRDLSVIFFSSNRSLAGDVVQGGRSPPPRAGLPYLNPPPLSPLILFSKNSEKIEKRREG